MVVEGDVVLRDEYHYEKFGAKKPLLRLGPGSIIGEESIFFDQNMKNSVSPTSDVVNLYRFPK